MYRLPKVRQHRGVEAIVFRQNPNRFGKIAHLSRIHDRHREAGDGQRSGRARFVAAGGLDHHEARFETRQGVNEGGESGFVVGDAPRGAAGRANGNIDARRA